MSAFDVQQPSTCASVRGTDKLHASALTLEVQAVQTHQYIHTLP